MENLSYWILEVVQIVPIALQTVNCHSHFTPGCCCIETYPRLYNFIGLWWRQQPADCFSTRPAIFTSSQSRAVWFTSTQPRTNSSNIGLCTLLDVQKRSRNSRGTHLIEHYSNSQNFRFRPRICKSKSCRKDEADCLQVRSTAEADIRQRVVLELGGWMRGKKCVNVETTKLGNVTQDLGTGSCEHANEPSGSINGGKFFDHLHHYQFLQDSALWNEWNDLERSYLVIKPYATDDPTSWYSSQLFNH
jgi:hypothetical protein